MNGVFLDTVGLIAGWDSSDQWHEPADAAFNQLLRDKTPLFSTSYVILESGNAASRRPYRHRVNVLRKYLMEAGALIDPTAEELDAAWEAFDRNEAGRAGIVDQVSFRCRSLSCDVLGFAEPSPMTHIFARQDSRRAGSHITRRPAGPIVLSRNDTHWQWHLAVRRDR